MCQGNTVQMPSSSIRQLTIEAEIPNNTRQGRSGHKQQATSMLGGGVRCHGGLAHKMHQSFRCDIDKPPTKDKNAKQGFDKYS